MGIEKPQSALVSYFRNFIFGVEDSLVSTVGLLSGIAIAGVSPKDILITGVVLIFVEAISMSAGSFLSESSAEEYTSHSERTTDKSYISAFVMFISYFISGFFPLLPYMFLPVSVAFWASIATSITVLFVLGIVSASVARVGILKNAIRMALIGGLAIGVGVLVGFWLG